MPHFCVCSACAAVCLSISDSLFACLFVSVCAQSLQVVTIYMATPPSRPPTQIKCLACAVCDARVLCDFYACRLLTHLTHLNCHREKVR